MSQFPNTEPEPETETDDVAEVPMTRRERRALARGGPAQKIAGPAGGRLPAPPVRHRNYASRKSG